MSVKHPNRAQVLRWRSKLRALPLPQRLRAYLGLWGVRIEERPLFDYECVADAWDFALYAPRALARAKGSWLELRTSAVVVSRSQWKDSGAFLRGVHELSHLLDDVKPSISDELKGIFQGFEYASGLYLGLSRTRCKEWLESFGLYEDTLKRCGEAATTLGKAVPEGAWVQTVDDLPVWARAWLRTQSFAEAVQSGYLTSRGLPTFRAPWSSTLREDAESGQVFVGDRTVVQL